MRASGIGGALALAVLASCGGETVDPARRPNVVFVLIDTLRADRLGAYGYEHDTSPFLDQLAREGALFEDVTAQAAWTLPSMVSLFHGVYLTDYRDKIDSSRVTLPQVFLEAGYDTIGVIGNVGMGPTTGFQRGFKGYDNRSARAEDGTEIAATRPVTQVLADMRQNLDLMAERGATEAGAPRPKFLYLHLMDPHMPFDPYPEFDGVIPELPAAEPMPRDWQVELFAAEGPPAPDFDPDWRGHWESIDRFRGRYDRGVRHTDEGLRAIFEELRTRGILDDAVVVIAADHGECLWERRTVFGDTSRYATATPDKFFHAAHGALLNREFIATPLIFWGAGVPPGVRIESPVENVDIFPSLLELANLPAFPGLDGRSLVPLMRGEKARDREAVFAYNHYASSVREVASGLKLISPNPDEEARPVPLQLYDVRADPDERNNLAPERPDDVRRLTALLDEWRRANPTSSTRDEPLDPEQEKALRALGYTADEIGR